MMQSLGTGARMECLRVWLRFYPFIVFSDSHPGSELPYGRLHVLVLLIIEY